MQSKVIIIGGGASGLTAAISAASLGAKVIILDHNHRAGQKILSTGNGKCNLSNINQDSDNYRGENPGFAMQVLKKFSVNDTKDFFNSLGLLLKERQGYLYPISEQASTVLDIMLLKCKDLGIDIICNADIIKITNQNQNFIINIKTNEKEKILNASRLILATGGKAAIKTGSDGSGYKLAKNFGHNIIDTVPALVGLYCKEDFFKAIAGVRVEANISLNVNDKQIITEKGELQITNYGISGIPVFQISRFASKAILQKQKVTADIDLLPSYSVSELEDFIYNQLKINSNKTMEQQLIGLLNKKLVILILKLCSININIESKDIIKQQVEKIVNTIKQFKVTIDHPNSFDHAQVCAGGVDTNEINYETLESKLVKKLYIIGELLDIDGACGGYNLQWAWSTGYIAGRSVAVEVNA